MRTLTLEIEVDLADFANDYANEMTFDMTVEDLVIELAENVGPQAFEGCRVQYAALV